jgi:hypothetical protein
MMLKSLAYLILPHQMTVMNFNPVKINKHSLDEFQTNLSYETSENAFNNDDMITLFNNFL